MSFFSFFLFSQTKNDLLYAFFFSFLLFFLKPNISYMKLCNPIKFLTKKNINLNMMKIILKMSLTSNFSIDFEMFVNFLVAFRTQLFNIIFTLFILFFIHTTLFLLFALLGRSIVWLIVCLGRERRFEIQVE